MTSPATTSRTTKPRKNAASDALHAPDEVKAHWPRKRPVSFQALLRVIAAWPRINHPIRRGPTHLMPSSATTHRRPGARWDPSWRCSGVDTSARKWIPAFAGMTEVGTVRVRLPSSTVGFVCRACRAELSQAPYRPSSQRTLGPILTLLWMPRRARAMDSSVRWNDESGDCAGLSTLHLRSGWLAALGVPSLSVVVPAHAGTHLDVAVDAAVCTGNGFQRSLE